MVDKKNNFKKISENRLFKIVTLISSLKNLSNSSYYDYDEEDIEILFKQIEEETEKSKKALINNKKKGKDIKL